MKPPCMHAAGGTSMPHRLAGTCPTASPPADKTSTRCDACAAPGARTTLLKGPQPNRQRPSARDSRSCLRLMLTPARGVLRAGSGPAADSS
eukprot:6865532-Prymnesium_polylepis.2